MRYRDPESELYCTNDHLSGQCTGRVDYTNPDDEDDGDAACETHMPETEPVDDFDADYPDYDNNSYLDGYTDGATSRTDTLTIIAPTGLRFTLTVN